MDDPHRTISPENLAAPGAVLIDRDGISAGLDSLATTLNTEYAGRELTVVAVMTGAVIFLADIVRRLTMPLRIATVSACSYPGCTTDPVGSPLAGPLPAGLAGTHVLLLDDILDTGCTLDAIQQAIGREEPASLKTCVLLHKLRPGRSAQAESDFAVFAIDDVFVVGYGMDYDNRFRDLPDICVLECPGTQGPDS